MIWMLQHETSLVKQMFWFIFLFFFFFIFTWDSIFLSAQDTPSMLIVYYWPTNQVRVVY
jgi:hypothetical protein